MARLDVDALFDIRRGTAGICPTRRRGSARDRPVRALTELAQRKAARSQQIPTRRPRRVIGERGIAVGALVVERILRGARPDALGAFGSR
jgi:hypothetical protein